MNSAQYVLYDIVYTLQMDSNRIYKSLKLFSTLFLIDLGK